VVPINVSATVVSIGVKCKCPSVGDSPGCHS
jgi:hypothetical protein